MKGYKIWKQHCPLWILQIHGDILIYPSLHHMFHLGCISPPFLCPNMDCLAQVKVPITGWLHFSMCYCPLQTLNLQVVWGSLPQEMEMCGNSNCPHKLVKGKQDIIRSFLFPLRRKPQEENLRRYWNQMDFPLKFTKLPIHSDFFGGKCKEPGDAIQVTWGIRGFPVKKRQKWNYLICQGILQ